MNRLSAQFKLKTVACHLKSFSYLNKLKIFWLENFIEIDYTA